MPKVKALIAGVSCTSVSQLNPSASSHDNTVETGIGATGATLWAVLNYIDWAGGVDFVILENVPGLKRGGQHEKVANMLEQRGYIVNVEALNTNEYGLPQDRERLFFLAMRRAAYPDVCSTDGSRLMQFAIDGTRNILPNIALADILLPDQHSHVQKHMQIYEAIPMDSALQAHQKATLEAIAKQRLDGTQAKRAKTKKNDEGLHRLRWTDLHADCWFRAAEADPNRLRTGSPDSLREFPALRSFSMRELDVLMTLIPHIPEETPRIIDLSQSVDRVGKTSSRYDGVTQERTQTLTPKGILFHTGKCRRLLGPEKLACQGRPTNYIGSLICLFSKRVYKCGFQQAPKPRDLSHSHNISRGLFFDVSKTTLSDSLLSDLAGNAFASPCVAAAIFAIYATGGASVADLRPMAVQFAVGARG